MPLDARTRRAEALVALITIALSALFIWDARRYSASPFEPIGSGAVPMGVAGVALVLALIVLVQAVIALRRGAGEVGLPELGLRVGATFLLTVAYAALLASGKVRYAFATVAFVVLGIVLIAEQPRKLLPWAALAALVLGFGLDFVFRTIFVTDIP